MTDCTVGFDTSNYTTSAAVCTLDGRIVANLKRPLPVKDGQRGLRQSDAVFEHIKNAESLTAELGAVLSGGDLHPVAVGVSATPRDVEGSYMPCFLSGLSMAGAFAAALNIPLYKFSHQNGHIRAALYSSGAQTELMSAPFVAFHVSGGTTECLYVGGSDKKMSVTLIGETDDINAGQLIDRIGVMMGHSFPAGREMERLASEYKGRIYRHPVCVREGRCSLSGAENIAKRLYEQDGDESAVAAFVFDFVCRTLIRMGEYAEEIYGRTPVLFAGGVMSNKLMRDSLGKRFDAYYAEPELSADNGAGIALLCRDEYLR